MKIFAVFGALLLVATQYINAQPTAPSEAGSFSKDVANITNSLLALQENPNNMITLACKISGFIEASRMHRIDFRIYGNIYSILNNLVYSATNMNTPERVLETIAHLQDNFDGEFDELNVERDVDASLLPSEINKLIDDFINRYTETLVDLFEDIYTQSQNLELETEKLAANSITLMDSLIEKVEKCLEIPRTEFKDTFQCREGTRTVLPGLAHDNSMIQIISNELNSLPWLRIHDNTSVIDLEWQIGAEKHHLLGQIQNVRDKRAAAEENSE